MGEDKKPDVDLELCKNNETLKTRFKTLWQTLGEKIVAKSEMLKNLEGDKLHVCILLFLYCLQGIPLGLKSSIPLILTRRSVPYTEQARFTIASYPFSMKVLWAPIVDSVFWAKFGRRKSWLVPAQYAIGFTMLVSYNFLDDLLGYTSEPESGPSNSTLRALNDTMENLDSNSTLIGDEQLDTEASQSFGIPDVASLTLLYFIMNFLAATQDVAVDGWALTMLKPSNVGYAATCNSVGQQIGWLMGFVVFTALESAGIVTLAQFTLFWGIVFLVTTTLIALFMTEKDKSRETPEEEELDLGIVEAYKTLWSIIRLPMMPVMIVVLFTTSFPFSAAEDIANLKLIEFGVPGEKIAALSLPMIPVKFIVTFFITKFIVGPKPIMVYLGAYPFRLLMCLSLTALVYITPLVKLSDGAFPGYYYPLVIAVFALHRATLYCQFLSLIAFMARISDPAIGGTYMTLLMTLINLGGMWCSSFVLWFVDQVTVKICVPDSGATLSAPLHIAANHTVVSPAWEENDCYGTEAVDSCKVAGGKCETITEGFYYMSVAWALIGLLWLVWGVRTFRQFQEIQLEKWRVIKKKKKNETQEKKTEEEDTFKYFYCF